MTTTTLIANGILNQHLIDPEICIRCNTCEATCPIDAITHDDTNYVVMADKCNGCMDCISPCPTGAIDNWRKVPAAEPYPIDAQYGWDELPPALSAEQLAAAASDVQDLSQAQAVIAAAAESTGSGTGSSTSTRASASSASSVEQSVQESFRAASFGATVPPLVRSACLHQPAWSEEPGHRHGGRQHQLHGGGFRQRDAPHRAGLWLHAFPRARRPIGRHHPPRERMPPAGRMWHGNTPSQARAMASAPATTMPHSR